RFSRRFGVPVIDSYGSTEGGAVVQRTPDMPPGALGRGGDGMAVLDPETGEESPPARFDVDGRLLNPDEAIGELVNRLGPSGFVRVGATLPVTETSKILKRVLRRDRWETDDDVWWQPEKGGAYRRLTPADVDALRAEFAARGRQPVLEAT